MIALLEMNFPMSADPSSDDGTSAMAGSSAAGSALLHLQLPLEILYYI